MKGQRVTSHVGRAIISLVPLEYVDPARVKVE